MQLIGALMLCTLMYVFHVVKHIRSKIHITKSGYVATYANYSLLLLKKASLPNIRLYGLLQIIALDSTKLKKMFWLQLL